MIPVGPELHGVTARRCIVCDAPMRRTFRKRGWWIATCVACGHQSVEDDVPVDHVTRVYGDEYFEGGAEGYTGYVREGTVLRAHGRRYGRVLSRYVAPGCVLDVGAAAGFVLQGLLDCGWRGVGLEPNESMAAYGRSELGLDVRAGTLESFPKGEQFDLVSMIQVLPHFVDPRRALEVAAAVTRPGGHWLVETWNRDSWTARLLGTRWHEYSPPSVLHWFSRAGLRDLVAHFGFVDVASGRPRKWLEGAHARAALEHSADASRLKGLVRLASRLIPEGAVVPYPSEDVFWALYRRQGG